MILRWLLTLAILTLANSTQAKELKNKAIVFQSSKTKVQFIEDGAKQYLVSSFVKGEKEIKRLLVWPGLGEGNLNQIEEVKKSEKLQIAIMKGSDGDYSFFELIIWNPETGGLVHLLSGDSFKLNLEFANEYELNVGLTQIEDAPDVGSSQLIAKTADAKCQDLISQITKIDSEKTAIVKRAGAIPKGKDLEKMNELSQKKEKLSPRKFSFNLKDFSKIKVSCE